MKHNIDPSIGPRGRCRGCRLSVEQIAERIGVAPQEWRAVSDAECAEGRRRRERAEANAATLAGCAGPHRFDVAVERKRDKRWRCALCAGEVSDRSKHWYERGLAHGRAEAAR